MESNKWLWQPRKNGPIHLRLTFMDAEGKRQQFTRSLFTNHFPTARKIRDTEFAPIVFDMEKARTQLLLIRELYPKLEAQLQVGVHGGYAKERQKAKMSLGKAVVAWTKELSAKNGNYETSTATASRYTAIATGFASHVGEDQAVAAITSKDIAAYRDSRLTEQGKSKKTLDLELTAIRKLFAYALDQGWVESNPVVGVKINQTRAERIRNQRSAKRRPPTVDEADTLCHRFPAVHRKHPIENFQDYAMFARYTGMRQGEIAQITTADIVLIDADAHVDQILLNHHQYTKLYRGKAVDGKLPCILVLDRDGKTTKTGEERIVPIATKLLPVVQRRIGDLKQGPIFPFAATDNGSTFGRLWLKKAKDVHTDLTMHGFRHYAISSMENNGANPAVCRLIVGHHDATVHGDYLHHTVAALHEAIERIA